VNSFFVSSLLFCLAIGQAGAGQNGPLPAQRGPSEVRVLESGGGYRLLVDGQPFYIKGAGLEYGDQEALARHGGNSFRTWTTDNGRETGQAVLDRALANGLYVTMGLHVAGERGGFDYDDPAQVAAQLERVKAEVLLYKDHPALLMWAIGNELNLGAVNPKVWDAVNQISEMIHRLDPNHPAMTNVAGLDAKLATELKSRAGSLDLIGIQLYADIANLSSILRQSAWNGPYIVTEWGPTGHWEVATTEWGAPIEDDSTEKADAIHRRYLRNIVAGGRQCLGSYVFLWGQKQERTPTWYGLFLDTGEETAGVDSMHHLWNGTWPENRSPDIRSLTLDARTAGQNIRLLPAHSYTAELSARDHDGDALSYRWVIMQESAARSIGGDREDVPAEMDVRIESQTEGRIRLKAPASPGNYRLFVTAHDGKGHAAHANIPFQVAGE
jgi:hypothetical protein